MASDGHPRHDDRGAPPAGGHGRAHPHGRGRGHGHEHGHGRDLGDGHGRGHGHGQGQGHEHGRGHEPERGHEPGRGQEHGHGHDHGHDYGHGHDHPGHDHGHGLLGAHVHAPPDTHGRAFLLGILLNAGFVLLEVVAGLWSGSLALLSDAGHNLGDVLGLALAWAGAWASARAPTARYTWGWRRAALLAALANAALLVAAVGAIAWEAVGRLGDPSPVDGAVVIGVAAAGIAVNGFTAWLFVRGRDDVNVRGAFLHMVADAAVSAGVVVAGLVVALTGWRIVDPLIGLAIAALVGWSTVSLGRQALALALDAVPPGIDPGEVDRALRGLPGVDGLHDLHVWPLGTRGAAMSAHLEMRTAPGDGFLADARALLAARFGIEHVTLQVETGAGCPQDCARPREAAVARRRDVARR